MKEDVIADIELIEKLVGRISTTNHPIIERALEENRAGVMSLASRLSTSGVQSPQGTFINNLKAGEHRRGAEVQKYHARRFDQLPRATPEEMAHYKNIAAQWAVIQHHIKTNTAIEEMWQELKKMCGGYVPAQAVHELMDDGQHHVRGVRPSYADPTENEARMVREALIYAIMHPEALEIEA